MARARELTLAMLPMPAPVCLGCGPPLPPGGPPPPRGGGPPDAAARGAGGRDCAPPDRDMSPMDEASDEGPGAAEPRPSAEEEDDVEDIAVWKGRRCACEMRDEEAQSRGWSAGRCARVRKRSLAQALGVEAEERWAAVVLKLYARVRVRRCKSRGIESRLDRQLEGCGRCEGGKQGAARLRVTRQAGAASATRHGALHLNPVALTQPARTDHRYTAHRHLAPSRRAPVLCPARQAGTPATHTRVPRRTPSAARALPASMLARHVLGARRCADHLVRGGCCTRTSPRRERLTRALHRRLFAYHVLSASDGHLGLLPATPPGASARPGHLVTALSRSALCSRLGSTCPAMEPQGRRLENERRQGL
jgi:hypothetical protein